MICVCVYIYVYMDISLSIYLSLHIYIHIFIYIHTYNVHPRSAARKMLKAGAFAEPLLSSAILYHIIVQYRIL